MWITDGMRLMEMNMMGIATTRSISMSTCLFWRIGTLISKVRANLSWSSLQSQNQQKNTSKQNSSKKTKKTWTSTTRLARRSLDSCRVSINKPQKWSTAENCMSIVILHPIGKDTRSWKLRSLRKVKQRFIMISQNLRIKWTRVPMIIGPLRRRLDRKIEYHLSAWLDHQRKGQ